MNKCHDIWPQLVWCEKTLLVPDARNGTRCRPSSRVGQGAPGDHHDDHDRDALGVCDYGEDGGENDDDDTSGVGGDWNGDNTKQTHNDTKFWNAMWNSAPNYWNKNVIYAKHIKDT